MFRRKRKNTPKSFNQPLPGYQNYLQNKLNLNDNEPIPSDLKKFHQVMDHIFGKNDDYKIKIMMLPSGQTIHLYYFNRMIDESQFQRSVVQPLAERINSGNDHIVTQVKDVIYSTEFVEIQNWKDIILKCLSGQLICHIDRLQPIGIVLSSPVKRSANDPSTEHQVFGPKIGFIEDSQTNVAMIRKFIKDPRLVVKEFIVGELSQTRTAVLYLDEYVDSDLYDLISKRLQNITVDNLVNSGQLEKLIVDSPMSLFPQCLKTERPDSVSYALSQGKIVIIVDNSTFALIAPTTHLDLYLTSEDHFLQVWHRTVIRLLRIGSLIVATLFPALYVALVAFHPELIPSLLALTIADTRNNIPFSAYSEAFLMVAALDILVESSMRLPTYVGQTVGIVGGLVIGQAAVEAGIISSTMVIVVASTAIASFTAPSWDLVSSVRILRYILLALASTLGLYGITLGMYIILMHLCHLTSFSKPYMSPISPLNLKELSHALISTRKSPPQKKG